MYRWNPLAVGRPQKNLSSLGWFRVRGSEISQRLRWEPDLEMALVALRPLSGRHGRHGPPGYFWAQCERCPNQTHIRGHHQPTATWHPFLKTLSSEPHFRFYKPIIYFNWFLLYRNYLNSSSQSHVSTRTRLGPYIVLCRITNPRFDIHLCWIVRIASGQNFSSIRLFVD